jgi:hypothetical protein
MMRIEKMMRILCLKKYEVKNEMMRNDSLKRYEKEFKVCLIRLDISS